MLRRAFFYVPASNKRFLQKALSASEPADTLVFDFEDGVAPSQKAVARSQLQHALSDAREFTHRRSEFCIRINGLDTGLEGDDVEAIAAVESSVDAIAIPKVHSPETINRISVLLQSILGKERADKLRLIALIESARGVTAVNDIATSDPRIAGLVFAAEDFCADTGIERTNPPIALQYSRSAIVMAAKAAGISAIDAVCTDYRDEDILRAECEDGVSFGFDGKQCVHPGQVNIIQELYAPSQKSIQRSLRIVNAKVENLAAGKGAFEVDGKMIDAPVWKNAEKILAKAVAAGLLQESDVPK